MVVRVDGVESNKTLVVVAWMKWKEFTGLVINKSMPLKIEEEYLKHVYDHYCSKILRHEV